MPLLNPAQNVFLISTSDLSCNSFLLKAKQNLLIDSGSSTATEEHISTLKKLNLELSDISVILHTHGHYDHFQADKIYSKAETFMSEFDSKHLIEENPEFTRIREDSFHPKIHSFLKENQVLEFLPFKLKVISTPGHTKGSLCFYEPDKKMLFSGDTIFFHTIGRTDLMSGSFSDLKNSVQKLSELDVEHLFPGHGKIVSGKKENRENFEYIKKHFF